MALSATRLEAARKGQFYPTPPEVVDLIAQQIQVREPEPTILDPSCGEGDALAQLGELLNGLCFGNEIERGRFNEAKKKLYHATLGPQESLACRGYFDIVFCNPPYDIESPGKRLEVEHLAQAGRSWLRPRGLMIGIVPQHILRRKDFWVFWLKRLTPITTHCLNRS